MIVNNVNAPIGVFDSGVGGLSILTHLIEQLPYERYIYLADTLHVPYGSRHADNICELTVQATTWLIEQECKLIVIACNSASAYGLHTVRQRFPHIPIVGLVPAVKPAILHTKTKQVAVLATPATLHGYLLNDIITEIAEPHDVVVHKYSIASLVPWVESGMAKEHIAVQELSNLLQELLQKKVDYLVLGCTHFPFFKGYIQQILQTDPSHQTNILQVIDSGQAVANRVASLLTTHQLLANQQELLPLDFYHTANLTSTTQVAERLLNQFVPHLIVNFCDIGGYSV